MARTFGAIVVIVLLLVCAGDLRVLQASPPQAAQDVELSSGWKLESAGKLGADGTTVSTAGYDDSAWHPVRRMPATVLQTLQDDGVYPNLYYGKNLLTEVPQDLYKQDWWYRTTFTAPAGQQTYLLDFPGINYRADIWLNGHRVADNRQIVGMYNDHQLDVTPWIQPGKPNVLAVKVTPERAIQDVDGVELADSWYDWINWRYLGYQGPNKNPANGNSFVPDRNAGIWKPVYLKTSGAVGIGAATVNTELPLPDTDSARLTVYAGVRNYSPERVSGVLRATITRDGKAPIHVDEAVTLKGGEEREISFTPDRFAALTVSHPDLWWPYTMGRPDLYDLRLDFVQNRTITDTATSKFGIRTITQGRDTDDAFTNLGTGGNFYLKVNGKDFLVRGATYTPDLLYKSDPDRDAAILRYAKDLGLNMLRLESKISSTRFVEMADEMGIPLMYGWMCCNQWEKWQQWDDEDRRVAQESMRSQIDMLRSHPSVFIWANGSDGRPSGRGAGRLPPDPDRPALAERHRRHRVVAEPGRQRSADVGRHPDGRAVQLATAVVLVQRPVRRGPRLVGRAGRQRAHPAVTRVCASSSRPTSCGRSTTRGTSTPGRARRTHSWSTCAGSSTGATARRPTPRCSPTRRSWPITRRPAPSSSRSPPTAGTATR